MVYLDDSSSGEFASPAGQHHSRAPAPDRTPHRPSDSTRNDRAADSEDSYDEIYSSSDEDSYHSDCGDIAEYWDPYCEQLASASDINIMINSSFCSVQTSTASTQTNLHSLFEESKCLLRGVIQ